MLIDFTHEEIAMISGLLNERRKKSIFTPAGCSLAKKVELILHASKVREGEKLIHDASRP